MPKLKPFGGQSCGNETPVAFDGRDIVGFWTWDAQSDCVWGDTFVAQLFNLDPDEVEAGLPLSAYMANIHGPDRSRVVARFRNPIHEGARTGIEYQIMSPDGALRLVLSRGRFSYDHIGRPIQGHGVIIDISDLQIADIDAKPTSVAAEHSAASSLDDAAAAAIAAFQAIGALKDPTLTARAEALLFEIGRKLAAQDAAEQRTRLN